MKLLINYFDLIFGKEVIILKKSLRDIHKINFLIISNIEEYLIVASLVFNVFLIFIQVIMRYIFHSSLFWSEELARYIFIWQIWLGFSLGFKYGQHIRVKIIFRYLSNKGKHTLEIFVLFLCLIFGLFLMFNSGFLVQQLFIRNALSPAMRLPLCYMYTSVTVGSGLAIFRLIQKLYEKFTFFKKEGA